MTLPEQALLKRRRQILDDETDAHRPTANQQANTGKREDIWVKSFITRLAGLVRDLHRKK